MTTLEHRAFLVLIAAVTLAFAWILWPFFGAVFWAAVIAITFDPLNRRFLRHWGGHRNLAALATVLVILFIVVLPVLLIAAALVREATDLFGRIQSGEIDPIHFFQPVFEALPSWATDWLGRFGLTDLGAIRDRLSVALPGGFKVVAAQALTVSQSTLDFVVSLGVMLYLLFFLLRDGDSLVLRMKKAIPLRDEQQNALFANFTVVIRATVKGDIFVAILQGAMGGLAFWFLGVRAALLWAVLMAFLSLLPAVGAALVWLPVAIYFLATGSLWHGILLIVYGVLVIGLVDNLVRPMLVGKATKIPDYIVLISTLGGIQSFGLHGFIVGPVIAAMFLAAWNILSESNGTGERN
ncbi:AI-2E family transporter [Roseiarcaceae bacterium H3SJ34-1]|uniref:AI-2E family transporter n=1 Tax=Terripilifer ovatus TaxID=3032367 RepID=UPI003AB9500C|nr:AI-2E family transporter [Roseiarcaceae bacterium H3SJ34-1]